MFTHIVFSGGGFSGFVYIGVLRYLEQETINIPHAAGTSIGSVFATLYTLGITSAVIEKEFKEVLPALCEYNIDWLKWIDYGGFDDASNFMKLLERFVPPTMTFLDHAKQTGKHLVICCTHLERLEPAYFSVDTTPNVLLSDAIRASCSIPGVFIPVKIGSEYYTDGAMVSPIPVTAFATAPHDEVMIVAVRKNLNNKSTLEGGKRPNALHILVSMLKTNLGQVTAHRLIEKQYKHILTFSKYPMDTLPIKEITYDRCLLEITDAVIDESIAVGYMESYEFFKQRQKPLLPPE